MRVRNYTGLSQHLNFRSVEGRRCQILGDRGDREVVSLLTYWVGRRAAQG
jgi:hypothetical protein